jgi:hypothetical protein
MRLGEFAAVHERAVVLSFSGTTTAACQTFRLARAATATYTAVTIVLAHFDTNQNLISQ